MNETTTIREFDPEVLLRENRWLQVLAERLFRDEHAAADAVQQTWLAYLRSPPKEPRAARSWLMTTLMRVRARMHRGESRRRMHEAHFNPRTQDESARESVERAELQGLVLNLVLALREPYRSTLLLRFFDGLKCTEIAERQGVAVGTVDSRLHRGLDYLRTQLDQHFGDRRDWMIAFATSGLVVWKVGKPVTAGLAIASCAIVASTAGIAWWLQSKPSVERDPAGPARTAAAPSDALDRGDGSVASPPTTADDRTRRTSPPANAPAGVPQSRSGGAQDRDPAERKTAGGRDRRESFTDPTASTKGSKAASPPVYEGLNLARLIRNYFDQLERSDHSYAAETFERVRTEEERLDAKTEGPLLADVAFWRNVLDRATARSSNRNIRGIRRLERIESKSRSKNSSIDADDPPWVAYRSRPDLEGEPDAPLRPALICLLPADRAWSLEAAEQYFAALPESEALLENALVLLVEPTTSGDQGLKELGYSTESSTALPPDLLAVVRAYAGCLVHELPFDMARVLLHGSSRVLDLAAMFPGMFSEVIVEGPAPSSPDYWNLHGTPIATTSDSATTSGNTNSSAFAPWDWLEPRPFASLWKAIEDAASAAPSRNPLAVQATAVQQQLHSAWWVTVTDRERSLEGPAEFAALADRTRNVIYVMANDRTRRLALYLNDDLVDLGEPITVRHGRWIGPLPRDSDYAERLNDLTCPNTIFEGRASRSLKSMLEHRYHGASGNARDVYPARLDLVLDR